MIRTLSGDCRAILPTLAAESVQCVVTSPPYFGLRDYGTGTWSGGDVACDHVYDRTLGMRASTLGGGKASQPMGSVYRTCPKCGAVRVDQQIGMEQTPDAYIAALVAVFREVRRVLADTGVLFLNSGDSYADKQLQMIPSRVALALQADGWWLRSQIPWLKRSAMPESVFDRPTSAVEYVYLLTKKATYFWDAEAIKRSSVSDHPSGNGFKRDARQSYRDANGARGNDKQWTDVGGTRNFRNTDLFYDSLEPPFGAITDAAGEIVALDVNPAAYADAHFATFPARLVEPLIRAGTSERGACPTCGAPWGRIVSRGEPDMAHRAASGADASGGYNGQSTKGHDAAGVQNASDVKRRILDGMRLKTHEWKPSCTCPAASPVPCVVLDPFSGAGTTMLVADRLGRDAVGVELNTQYVTMARNRIVDDCPLFVEAAE